MAGENTYHDNNHVAVIAAVSSTDGKTIVLPWADPVTHRLLTSSSGGGGFTVLQPTETPNGVITVFTFPSATAQPTFVVSDNAMMQATTKSGTVNWTWDAGLLQATMTIPPQDDIVAIQ